MNERLKESSITYLIVSFFITIISLFVFTILSVPVVTSSPLINADYKIGWIILAFILCLPLLFYISGILAAIKEIEGYDTIYPSCLLGLVGNTVSMILYFGIVFLIH